MKPEGIQDTGVVLCRYRHLLSPVQLAGGGFFGVLVMLGRVRQFLKEWINCVECRKASQVDRHSATL